MIGVGLNPSNESVLPPRNVFTILHFAEGCRISVPVGIENRQISDRAFSATSDRRSRGWYAPPYMARLNAKDTRRYSRNYIGAWCAERASPTEYLQVRHSLNLSLCICILLVLYASLLNDILQLLH